MLWNTWKITEIPGNASWNDGICFGIDGKPRKNLEMPGGYDGICFGIRGKPLEYMENQEKTGIK